EWTRQLIERQVMQLVRLLDDLLDVKRFTHGLIVLKTEPTELGSVIESAIDVVQESAALKSQTLIVERCAEAVPVLADPARLTQIVSNLLVNAVKYCPE